MLRPLLADYLDIEELLVPDWDDAFWPAADSAPLPRRPVRWAADELLWLVHQRRVEITKLAALRDALLPELLSGRIRAPEAAMI